jgi:hypothetical protein
MIANLGFLFFIRGQQKQKEMGEVVVVREKTPIHGLFYLRI